VTEQELRVIDLTKELWGAFLDLPVQHPDDQNEFRFIQNMILAR
jgi:hypothetical protein